uniref:Uncharacterized protein n=1 Tax=Physcomitrium patens TaxID=3218 RepID=A0A2K1K7E6_PHYPA|nr:hypothetical protein PHYPA_011589 [Physcomitrium patens]
MISHILYDKFDNLELKDLATFEALILVVGIMSYSRSYLFSYLSIALVLFISYLLFGHMHK